LDFDVVHYNDVENTQKTEVETGFFVGVEEFEDREETVGCDYLVFVFSVFVEDVVDLVADGDQG